MTYLSHSCTVSFQKNAVRDSIKRLTKIQKYYIHCIFFILQVGDHLIEEDENNKAWLFHDEHMLIISFFNWAIIKKNLFTENSETGFLVRWSKPHTF